MTEQIPICHNKYLGCFTPSECGALGHCGDRHPDDAAIDRFAAMMKDKMAASRAKGRSGWQECSETYLIAMLRGHIDKGDMRDVACIAMMIHLNRENTPHSRPVAKP